MKRGSGRSRGTRHVQRPGPCRNRPANARSLPKTWKSRPEGDVMHAMLAFRRQPHLKTVRGPSRSGNLVHRVPSTRRLTLWQSFLEQKNDEDAMNLRPFHLFVRPKTAAERLKAIFQRHHCFVESLSRGMRFMSGASQGPASKNLYFKPSDSGRSKRRMAF